MLPTKIHAAGRAANNEVRAAQTATQQAARVAARLAGGGTFAPGGGGGGGGGVSGSTGDAVRQVGAVVAGAAGSLLVFPAAVARRTRPRGRAPRSLDDRNRRRAVIATRGLQRYNILRGARGVPIVYDRNNRGRLREARPPEALIGPRMRIAATLYNPPIRTMNTPMGSFRSTFHARQDQVKTKYPAPSLPHPQAMQIDPEPESDELHDVDVDVVTFSTEALLAIINSKFIYTGAGADYWCYRHLKEIP